MFGLSFGEIVVLLLVGIVVIGPRQLPMMLRTLGRWVTKLRRMAFDMRMQSGIDDILRDEGLDRDLQQLRAILRRPNVLDALAIDIDAEIAHKSRTEPAQPEPTRPEGTVSPGDDLTADEREYPEAGVDAYEAAPEDLDPYRTIEPTATVVEVENTKPGQKDSDADQPEGLRQ